MYINNYVSSLINIFIFPDRFEFVPTSWTCLFLFPAHLFRMSAAACYFLLISGTTCLFNFRCHVCFCCSPALVKQPINTCLFLCVSVRPSHFTHFTPYFFLIFYMKVGDARRSPYSPEKSHFKMGPK